MMLVLSPEQWHETMDAHLARATTLTKEHLRRRQAGEKHPIWDFLFDYYPIKPATLAKWHPGVGTALLIDDPADIPPHANWRDYRFVDWEGHRAVTVDVPALWERRGKALKYIADLLERTQSNEAHFDCFGLHEWAMVYQDEETRHPLPLRLGSARTDEVVRTHQIRCTHYDAFRFFTTPARPLNFRVLTREDQPSCDQRGCLHAGMDLYKWGHKLGPLLNGSTWLDCFELARDIRLLDMQASPYDCTSLGYDAVPIETPAGKAEYVTRQRQLSQRAVPLRQDLIRAIVEV